MSAVPPVRPSYADGQFLDAGDFTAEQQYHLAMLRRHHIAHHTHGTVTGLDIGLDADTGIPFVAPGVGIDAYGRELIVSERLVLSANLFGPGGADAVDVALVYDRVADAAGSRWVEQPRVVTTERRQPGAGPPTPSDAVAAFGPADEPPDDPAQAAPLFLGQLRRPDTPGDPPIVDQSGREYVELVASAVSAGDGTARLELAAVDGPFALYAGADASQLTRRLAIGVGGELTVDAGLTVGGALTVGGQLALEPAAATGGWGLQLVSDPGASATELRVQMGPATGSERRRTVVGAWSQSGSFTPLLTVDEDGTVTVSGDMVVNGTVHADGGVVPAELSASAAQYAAAAMTSGIGSASALMDKVTTGAFTPYVARPAATTTTAVRQTTRQLVAHLSQDPSAHAESFAQELKDRGEHLIGPLINALRRL